MPSQHPITTVDLWVRPVNGVDPDTWTLAGTVGTGGAVSGEFAYSVLTDGIYYFATVAHDAADKHEPQPHGEGDRHTIRDSQIGAPSDVTLVMSQEWSTVNEFDVVWTHPDDLSGIVAVTYQLYPESGAPLDPVHEFVDDPEIEGIHVPAEGRYTLWLWVEDRAGNVGTPAPATPQTVLKYDRTIAAPLSLAVQPRRWSAANDFDLVWTNPNEVSGITGAYYKLSAAPPVWEDDGIWVHGGDLEQIEGITVPGEGRHTLYLWLKDVAGNVDHRRWMSVTLGYDASPPEDVSLIAPSLSPSMGFEVGWAASDYHSGVISYTVAVSGWPTHEWQPWLLSTAQTSALYSAPRADDVFDFRVTAYDRAGNGTSDEARTRVDLQHVYLALGMIRSQWLPWHQVDVYEQNNTPRDAYGSILPRVVYESAIWNETDPKDFYYFVPDVSGVVEVTLTGLPRGVDLDLIIRILSPGPPATYPILGSSRNDNPWHANEKVVFLATAGETYWVEVQPYADRYYHSTHPSWRPNSYRLEWKYN
jgi:hypothetical protein